MKEYHEMTHEEYVDYCDFQTKVYKLVAKYSEDHHVRYTNMFNFSRLTGIPFDEHSAKYKDTEEARKLVDSLSGPYGDTIYRALVIKQQERLDKHYPRKPT